MFDAIMGIGFGLLATFFAFKTSFKIFDIVGDTYLYPGTTEEATK